MKYVMFEAATGHKFPVIFPDMITHADVRVEGMKVVSAGDVISDTGECIGRSASLNLAPASGDSLLVLATLTNNSSLLYWANAI